VTHDVDFAPVVAAVNNFERQVSHGYEQRFINGARRELYAAVFRVARALGERATTECYGPTAQPSEDKWLLAFDRLFPPTREL